MAVLIRNRIKAFVIACMLLLGVHAVAEAHTTLVMAEPAPGGVFDQSPARIRLIFSDRIEGKLAKLALIGSDGARIDLVAASDPHLVEAIIAPVPLLKPGTYRVEWRVVSEDGHPVSGDYLFTVGAASAVPPVDSLAASVTWGPAVAGAPLIPAVLRGLALGVLLTFAGLLLFMAIPATAAGQMAAPYAKLASWLGVSAVLLLTLSFLAWIMNAAPDHHITIASISAARASNEAEVSTWRIALAVLALWGLWLVRRPRIALVFAAGAVLVSGASGHSAELSPMLAIPSKAAHLLATAAWLGGLAWFIARARTDATDTARAADRLSSVALIAAGLVLISGVIQSVLFLPALADLFRTAYGVLIIAKAAGFAVLIAYGAKHRYHMLPTLESDGGISSAFSGSLRQEIVVMAIVVLIGGLLAFTPTPAHRAPATPSLAPTN